MWCFLTQRRTFALVPALNAVAEATEAQILEAGPGGIPQAGRHLRAGRVVSRGDAAEHSATLVGQGDDGVLELGQALQDLILVAVVEVLGAAQEGERRGRDRVDDHDDLGGPALERGLRVRRVLG